MITIPLIVSILAPGINCIQLVPQLWKIVRTKRVKDLSLGSLLLIITTNLLWLLHGYYIMDQSLLVAGIISVLINGTLIGLYFRYR